MTTRRLPQGALLGLFLAGSLLPLAAEENTAARLAALREPVRGSLELRAPDEERLMATLGLPEMKLELELWWHSDRAPDAEAWVRGEKGKRERVELPPPMTLRGRVSGLPGTRVAAALSERGLSAVIFLADGSALALDPDGSAAAHGKAQAVLLRPVFGRGAATCGNATHGELELASGAQAGGDKGSCALPGACPPGNPPACGGLCKAEIAYDTDNELYVELGSNVNAVIAFIDSAANVLNTQYEGQVSISHQIVHYEVRTSANDGYSFCQNPNSNPPDCCGTQGCLLGQMSDQWTTDPELAAVERDLVHLLSGEGSPSGSPAGVGHIGAVCGSNAYSWSKQRTPQGCVEQTVQNHEIGHNWGAEHTISGTMNPFSSCSLQFAACSIEQIGCYRETIAPICLEPLVTPGSLNPAWVDFAYVGPEHGTAAQPFRTLERGIEAVTVGGTVRIKAGSTSETATITKAMTLQAEGGAVTIGQ